MFCQFPRNTCLRKRKIHSRNNRAVQKPCFSSFYSSSWWLYPSPPSPPTQPERQGNCLKITGMLMKTPTTSQWTLDTTFQMCHLQMGLFRSGPGHQVHFYNENNNVTMTTRASWYLWSILSIGEDAQTISLDATISFSFSFIIFISKVLKLHLKIVVKLKKPNFRLPRSLPSS